MREAQEAELQRQSSVAFADAAPCQQMGDGGQLCGIPIGYEGTNRSGYYYLPKVCCLLQIAHEAAVFTSSLVVTVSPAVAPCPKVIWYIPAPPPPPAPPARARRGS